MKCPVCLSAGIPDDANQCPQCLSELEAFHLTGRIKKANNTRKVVAIIASSLFLIVLFAWVFTFFFVRSDQESSEPPEASNETIQLKADNEKLLANYNSLKKENEELKERLKTLAIEKANRKKDYKVLYGETLYGISRKVYGNGFKYVDLAKDNNIKDPAVLQAGQTLVIYY